MSIFRSFLLIICAVFALASPVTYAADKGFFSTEPKDNEGKKWRIGYYEGGEYIAYQKHLINTVKGLMELGWLEKTQVPKPEGEETKAIWDWLASELKSDYIEFVSDAHYSANWDDVIRKETVDNIVIRLNQVGDVDLMIAMGTWAGRDLANYRHKTATLVFSSSDPLEAGIIKSVEDSGYDHVHATFDPDRFARQVQVFHEMVGFERLGVAYEDTIAGRSYAAINAVEVLAQERNFDIVRCYTQSDVSDTSLAERDVIDCFNKLVESSDAVYVTRQGGVNSRSIPSLVDIANRNNVPTFSQSGSEEVGYGFLASLSRAGGRYVGEFHAQIIAKVFNGAKPNDLNQHFREPPKIALNLKTAEIIGFDPPVVLLGAADELFNDIHSPQ
ncbi:MAG: ABC transporter substrate binding protein [Pseudomonadota bacterium]